MARRRRDPSRSDRCPRCALHRELCICAAIAPVSVRTRMAVVRHARELDKPSGTARIAQLALPELALLDYRDEIGDEPPPWLEARRATARSPSQIAAALEALPAPRRLLFPTGAPLAPGDAAGTLIVLDGTWRQARAMYQRIPGLSALPAVRLEGPPRAVERLRTPARDDGRSTLEAIAEAVERLEGEAAAAPLWAIHAAFVVAARRGKGR